MRILFKFCFELKQLLVYENSQSTNYNGVQLWLKEKSVFRVIKHSLLNNYTRLLNISALNKAKSKKINVIL